jgi:hypothetical protein
MQRVATVLLWCALFVFVGPWAGARLDAATITVDSTDLAVVQSDGKCTLIEAMENARSANGGYQDCAVPGPTRGTWRRWPYP